MEARIARWGYFLLPSDVPSSPGFPGLIIAMRPEPTGEHYDPEQLHLYLRTPDGLARWTALNRNPSLRAQEKIVLCKVTLRDRFEKRVDFFTFGGSLEVEETTDETIFTITSPAPILELTGHQDDIPDHLAAETEALVAEYHAQWGRDHEGFTRRLASQNPLQIYIACLKTVHHLYQEFSFFRNEYPRFYGMVHMEKGRLIQENLWSDQLPDLGTMLCPQCRQTSSDIRGL